MKKKTIQKFEKIDAIVLMVLKIICVTMLSGLILFLTANVFVRYAAVVLEGTKIMVPSLHWFDEIVELMYAAMVFYGAAALWIYRKHFGVGDWISPRIGGNRGKSFYKLFIEILKLIFVLVFFIYSLKLTFQSEDLTNALQIRKSFLYMCMPISSFIMVLYSIKYVVIESIGVINPKAVAPLLKKQHS